MAHDYLYFMIRETLLDTLTATREGINVDTAAHELARLTQEVSA